VAHPPGRADHGLTSRRVSVEVAPPVAVRARGLAARVRGLAARPAALLARRTVLAVVGLTLLAAAIRFYRLGHQGFWFDEANTAFLVRFSPGVMLGLLPRYESTPPLYYCLAWVWVRVFGDTEAGLRSLSAVAGVLTVPVLYGAGAKLVSRRAGLIAAALAACSPLLIWYSQEARSYVLLVGLSAASLLGFAYLLERPSRRAAAVWVAASALALATHYYAILVVIPEALWLLFVHRRRRVVRAAVGVVGLCGLALIPLAISQEQSGRGNWIARASLARRVKEVVPQFVIGFGSPAYAVLEPVAFALAVFGVVLAATRSSGRGRHGLRLAAGLAVAGLVLNLLLVGVGIDDLLTRNLIALWVPAAIAVAGGFAARRAQRVGGVAAAALCLIGLAAAIGVARERALQRPDWRGVAALLGTRPTGPAATGGRMVLVQHYRDRLPLALYLPHLDFVRTHRARVSEFDVVSFSAPPSAGFCWWGSACNLWASRMQASYPIPGFRPVWRRHIYQFTVLHMVAVHGPVLVRASEVARLLTTTRMRQDELLVQR
jgi:mannosyltransferase